METESLLESFSKRYPGLPLILLGFIVFAGGVGHYLHAGPSALALAEALLTVPLLAAYLYTAYHLQQEELSPHALSYLLLTAFTFGVFGASLAGLFVGIHYVQGISIHNGAYIVFLSGATTSAVGPPIGYYYLRADSRREKLEAKTEQISSLNQRLSVLNRVLRHNMRNELTVLQGSLRMLEDPEPTASARRMEDSIDRLLHLSNHAKHLRDVWETDRTVAVDISRSLRKSVEHLRAEHPAVDIEMELPEGLLVCAHPKLGMALKELVQNAIVHNDPETLTVSIEVTVPAQSSSRVRIAIQDTGVGIPETEIALLGESEETFQEHLAGLGLWFVYWTVQKSDGTLEIDSAPGEGTRVVLELSEASGTVKEEQMN